MDRQTLTALWMRGHLCLHATTPDAVYRLTATEAAVAFAAIPGRDIVPFEEWLSRIGEKVDEPAPPEALAEIMGGAAPIYKPPEKKC